MTLWDKYMGKSPTMETIYKDDYLPLVKKHIEEGKTVKESCFEALTSMNCQLPSWAYAPLQWVSDARKEIKP